MPIGHDRIPILAERPRLHIVYRYLHRADQRVPVALALLVAALAEHVHRDHIDVGHIGKVKVLAPEQQIRAQLHARPAVQRLVQLDLAEIPLLRRHILRLVHPHLQRVILAPCVLRIRRNRPPQTVDPQIALLPRAAAVIPFAARTAAHLEAMPAAQHRLVHGRHADRSGARQINGRHHRMAGEQRLVRA